MQSRTVVAEIDPRNCPLMTVLDPRDPDQSVEEKFFAGWSNALTPHKYWGQRGDFRVVEDEGKRVLEHDTYSDRCLTTGDPLWQDYTITATVRQMHALTVPGQDNRYDLIGRTGLMFRYQTLRHYYLYCIEGYDRLVLYARADEDWGELAWERMPIDRAAYHELKLETEGDSIRCYFDGKLALSVEDDTYPTGKVGYRTTTVARLAGLTVQMTTQQKQAFETARSERFAQVAAEQEKYPKARVLEEIVLSDLGAERAQLVHLRSDAAPDLVLEGLADAGLAAYSREGERIWTGDRTGEHLTFVPRPEGEGCDLYMLIDGVMTCLHGHTGEVVATAPLPDSGPYQDFRGQPVQAAFGLFTPADLTGVGRQSDLVLREENHGGGYTLWAYTHHLEPMWTVTVERPKYGHSLGIADIDSDGRDEVLAGCSLLDDDGSVIWRVPGAEYWDIFGADHMDAARMGYWTEGVSDTFDAVIATGTDGVYFVDGATGTVRAHYRVGHAQGLTIGNFRHDLPGKEVLVGDRWGNYGVLNLYTARGERLLTFEPDNISQGGSPVRWTGDGRELLFLYTSDATMGLWDGWGRRVVEVPADLMPQRCFYGKQGVAAVMDMNGDGLDELVFTYDGLMRIFAPA